ncbi:hypothetical protein G7B40_036880 [Aetokthonos hydrillicola Thurmond2011]|jgi:hypothetical protein|uniref:Uncharacterized protein n=1 Tax=Aetokthonos hydrillicola Thurmond2011 TaxID=2712845 RepID=A0AAP5IH87_9CYAN|nr:hypothetical protein [Aetokthonos hydrillicola]MBW4589015.1 hypothetical protein [Aetokthonos hydrillicola CCALA 1050]MDR9900088.1 hypothetical protein [Aetokthonos hydrillicola Thurmond2011]
MTHLLPANENLPVEQMENSPGATQTILNIAENVTELLNQSETVELAKVGSQTTEDIFSMLIQSGGKPVAVILAIAILVASTALPIFALGQCQRAFFESQHQTTLQRDISPSSR